MPLSKKERDDWCAALRSGRYKQSQVYLITAAPPPQRQFCALGVLGVTMGFIEPDCILESYTEKVKLEKEVYRKLGVELGHDSIRAISVMNDSKKMTFAEIANHIEAHLPTRREY